MTARRTIPALTLAAATLLLGAEASALVPEQAEELEGVGVVDRRGEPLPLDAEFVNPDGRTVRLGDFFDGERPVIMVPSYFACPLLCPQVTQRLQTGLNEMSWTAGDEFRIVSFSFDHTDTPVQSRSKQQLALLGYGPEVDEPDEAWTYLTTDARTAREVCEALGFRYKYLPENGEFTHNAAVFFCTPDGKVHNFIEGLEYPGRNLTLALSEAADGKVGTVFERIVFSCFQYDPATGEYVIHPMNVMRIGASGAAVVLIATLGVLFLRGRLRVPSGADADGSASYSPARFAVGQES